LVHRKVSQSIDSGPGETGGNHAVVGSDDRVNRQRVHSSSPVLPLVAGGATWNEHRPPLGHEHIGDAPVVAAGSQHAGHVPCINDGALLNRKHHAVHTGGSVWSFTSLQ